MNLNEEFIEEAFKLSDLLTREQVVDQALQEYIQLRKQLKLLDLFGSIEYHDNYNIKEQRNFKA
jgi:Bacterial antitoxin of type II TA system, VapB